MLFDRGSKTSPADDSFEVAELPMSALLVVCDDDIESGARGSGPLVAENIQLISRNVELSEFTLQVLGRRTEIEKGSDGHIASDTRGAVEIEKPHAEEILRE